MASFLYCSQYSYCSLKYRDSDSCRNAFNLKGDSKKVKSKLIAISRYCNSWKSDNYRNIGKKQKIIQKMKQRRFIALKITMIISNFWVTNIIFFGCIIKTSLYKKALIPTFKPIFFLLKLED